MRALFRQRRLSRITAAPCWRPAPLMMRLTTPAARPEGVLLANRRIPIRQGGTLHVDIAEPTAADVHVLTEWTDECLVQIWGDWPGTLYDHNLVLRVDEDDGVISIRRNGDSGSTAANAAASSMEDASSYRIRATLPQVFNVMVRVAAGNVTAGPLIEGDVTIQTGRGDITARNVQGHAITLFAPRGSVAVKNAEGNVHLRAAKNVDAVLLSGQNVAVEQGPCARREYDSSLSDGNSNSNSNSNNRGDSASNRQNDLPTESGEVRIGGLYAEQGTVRSAGSVSISTSHGALDLDTSDGAVQVMGVNGCAAVTAALGPVSVHFDALSPGSLSWVRCERGDISASVAEDIAAGLSVQSGFMPEVLTPSFQGDVAAHGASGALKPLPQRRRGLFGSERRSSVGKIDVEGAWEQRLNAFWGETGDKGSERMGRRNVRYRGSESSDRRDSVNGSDRSDQEEELGDEARLELVAPQGRVRLEALSWMDRIKQKTGFRE